MPGKNPIVFQVEQACAFDSNEERAIRVQMKKILGESDFEVLLDLILSETTLFTQEMSRLGRPTDKLPEVRPDKATEIMDSYRESLSSLPKMDELALDL